MTGASFPQMAFWSEAVSDPSRELVSFYSDTGPDNRGRFLREIQNWSDDELELTHDYIQWLFPLAERSSFNLNAPILNAYTINRFRSDADLRRRMQTSLVRMLAFYGLQMRATVPLSVACAESFPERAENWLSPSNHNHLRITRILKSLCLLGLEDQASAFFRFLEVLYKMESAGPYPRISLETFGYWRSAVDTD
jgi:Opioid growth factor receptor (OGFr) conserved region